MAPEIGPVLHEHRRKRRLTLDQVSSRSGVSKSMLSQIERGKANPTFAVLWSLTRALGISLSDLTSLISADGARVSSELITAAGTPEIRNTEGTCLLRILSPPIMAGQVEWYEIIVAAGGMLQSAPHAQGAWEHLTALDGDLTVVSGDEEFELLEGGTVRYPADVNHSIINYGPSSVTALLVTVYR